MNNGLNIVYCDITSFTEIGSIGAEHWYGKLKQGWGDWNLAYDNQVELLHPLTQKEATYLNKKSNNKFSRYKKGELSHRFDTEEEVEKFAINIWREKFPDGLVLISGSSGTCQPQKPLDAVDKKLLGKLVVIWNKFKPFWEDGNDGWDKHEKPMRLLCSQWYKLLGQEYN
jgi:hypothetical protein